MTEKEVQLLGFKKVKVSKKESGDKKYHYYILDITKGLSFISNSNKETINDEWYVEFFDTEIPLRFDVFSQTQALLNTINKAKIK